MSEACEEADEESAPPQVWKPEPAAWQEIANATSFVAPEPPSDGPGIKVLSAMIDAMSALDGDHPLDVVLTHARQVCDADTAVLSIPVDANTMEIRSVSGERADAIVGQRFDRKTSIAGMVLDSGESAFVDMESLKSPILSLRAFGPMLMTPLRGTGAVGTLGPTKLSGRPPFLAADLDIVHDFADLASIALQVDDARAIREDGRVRAERERIATDVLQTAIMQLAGIALGLASLSGSVGDDVGKAKLRQLINDTDELISSIRASVFGS